MTDVAVLDATGQADLVRQGEASAVELVDGAIARIEKLNGGAAALVPFTPPFNVTGQPAISLPLRWNDDGLPIGVELVAGFGREDLLLRVASQLEEPRLWADRRPPTSAI